MWGIGTAAPIPLQPPHNHPVPPQAGNNREYRWRSQPRGTGSWKDRLHPGVQTPCLWHTSPHISRSHLSLTVPFLPSLYATDLWVKLVYCYVHLSWRNQDTCPISYLWLCWYGLICSLFVHSSLELMFLLDSGLIVLTRWFIAGAMHSIPSQFLAHSVCPIFLMLRLMSVFSLIRKFSINSFLHGFNT